MRISCRLWKWILMKAPDDRITSGSGWKSLLLLFFSGQKRFTWLVDLLCYFTIQVAILWFVKLWCNTGRNLHPDCVLSTWEKHGSSLGIYLLIEAEEAAEQRDIAVVLRHRPLIRDEPEKEQQLCNLNNGLCLWFLCRIIGLIFRCGIPLQHLGRRGFFVNPSTGVTISSPGVKYSGLCSIQVNFFELIPCIFGWCRGFCIGQSFVWPVLGSEVDCCWVDWPPWLKGGPV